MGMKVRDRWKPQDHFSPLSWEEDETGRWLLALDKFWNRAEIVGSTGALKEGVVFDFGNVEGEHEVDTIERLDELCYFLYNDTRVFLVLQDKRWGLS